VPDRFRGMKYMSEGRFQNHIELILFTAEETQKTLEIRTILNCFGVLALLIA
jgi:hypothetical protein